MRMDHQDESSNIEDRRGMRMPGGRAGGVGLGTLVLALVASYFFGIDPGAVINVASQFQGAPAPQSVPAGRPPADDEVARSGLRLAARAALAWGGPAPMRRISR